MNADVLEKTLSHVGNMKNKKASMVRAFTKFNKHFELMKEINVAVHVSFKTSNQ